MNRHFLRSGAAVLALVLCLSTAPVASAKQQREYTGGEPVIRERIVRVIKKIQRLFGGIIGQEDVMTPPRPLP